MQRSPFVRPSIHLLLFLLLCTPQANFAQDYTRYILDTLSSPHFDGRGYVNGGAEKAATFIADQFDSLGLEKVKDSYYQGFMLSVNTFPGEMTLSINDKELTPGVDYMVDPMSGSGRAKRFDLHAVNIFKRKQLDKLTEEVYSLKNTALLIELPDTLSPNGKMLYMQTIYLLAEQWPIVLQTSEKLTWSISNTSVANPIFLVYSQEINKKDQISFAVDNKKLSLKQNNVIALKRGKSKADKYLIICAHYDHLGRMGQDTYFPGANDNASGVAEMLSVAAKIQEEEFEHSILFIAFAGEEAGLKGSFHFVNEDLIPLDSIDFVLNLDISGTGDEGITVVNATKFEDEYLLLNQINDSLLLIDDIKSRGPAANSDHYPFYEKGVPSFFIYTRGGIKAYHDVFDRAETLPLDKAEELILLYQHFLRALDKK